MPGIDCTWVECFDTNGLDLELLFGVFHAEIITSELYLGSSASLFYSYTNKNALLI